MEATSEVPTTDLFGVPVWDLERLVPAAAAAIFIIAVFVVLWYVERAEDRRREAQHTAEQHLRSPRPIR